MGRRDAQSSVESGLRPIIWLIAVSHIFYFYRYVWQINSSETSPTYADTPLWLQALRYAVVFSSYACVIASSLRRPTRSGNGIKTTAFIGVTWCGVVLLIAPTLGGGWNEALQSGFLFKALYVVPVAMSVLLLKLDGLRIRALFDWILIFLFPVHTLYNCVQYYLFLADGRLPALGYSGGLVRFGGGWDDPNGYGLYCVFVALWCVSGLDGRGERLGIKLLLCVTALVQLALTYSYSSWVALICGTLFLLVFMHTRRVCLTVVVLGLCSAFGSYLLRETILNVADQKSDSAYSRIDQLALLKNLYSQRSGVELLFGERTGAQSAENVYQMVFMNFGLVGLFCVTATIAVLLFLFSSKIRAVTTKPGLVVERRLLIATGSFTVAIGVASAAIPYFQVFPVNLFYWLMIFMAWRALKISEVAVAGEVAGQRSHALRDGRELS